MKKSELLSWLQEECRQWEALLEQIGPERMDQPGVNGNWSMKDIVAHQIGWQVKQIAEYLGINENNVSVMIRRALTRLQRDWPQLQEKDDE